MSKSTQRVRKPAIIVNISGEEPQRKNRKVAQSSAPSKVPVSPSPDQQKTITGSPHDTPPADEARRKTRKVAQVSTTSTSSPSSTPVQQKNFRSPPESSPAGESLRKCRKVAQPSTPSKSTPSSTPVLLPENILPDEELEVTKSRLADAYKELELLRAQAESASKLAKESKQIIEKVEVQKNLADAYKELELLRAQAESTSKLAKESKQINEKVEVQKKSGETKQAPAITFVRKHVADVVPTVDFLHLELDDARVVSRTEPAIKGLSNGKGARQLVQLYVTGRNRTDTNGQSLNEAITIPISIWGAVGDIVPTSPQVGDIVRLRGFTGCVGTTPYDKWHKVELSTNFFDLHVQVLPEDTSIPWERYLNPNRTIVDRSNRVVPLNNVTLATQPLPTLSSVPVALATQQQPVLTIPSTPFGPMTSAPKFCTECGGILYGPNRRALCSNGTLHQ